jgi:hypothetical protein
MTMSEFHDLVESFARLVEALGLVAGGLWAAWTFHKLQKARKAILDVRRARLSEQEQRTKLVQRQPVLQIGLRVEEESERLPTPFVRITVLLANRGDQNLTIQFNESFVTIGRVTEDEDGRVRMEAVNRLGAWMFDRDVSGVRRMPERIFRVGQKRRMAFVAPIHAPGAYVVQCRAAYFRIPFDGEAAGKSEPLVIDAIEQVACIIKGDGREAAAESAASKSHGEALREAAAPGPLAVHSPPALVDKPREANP